MKKSENTIITCAVTGSVHTPSMSPYLPVSADEIADAAVGAAEAGAAIIHLHARDPETGKPDQRPESFAPILQSIKERSDVVVNITTGGSVAMTIEERLRPAVTFAPEVASLNIGTMNFALFPMLDRYPDLKGWEREYLAATRSGFFRNTFEDIERTLSECGGHGTRFEVECYDTAHLYALSWFADRGMIKPPFFIQTVFGILGGIGSHEEDIIHMKRTADRLFGDQYHWSVLGAGAAQMRIAAMSACMGGHVRVGLEDSLWMGRGRLAENNAQQVTAIREVIEASGRKIAAPEDARAILGLKGNDKVGF